MAKKDTAKRNFILEIGTEEIPARFLEEILEDCGVKAKQILSDSRVGFEDIKTYGSMRRIVLFVQGLDDRQNDLAREVKGPPKNIAYDENNNPTKAARGFAASQNVPIESLVIKNVNGGEYIFALKNEKGSYTEEVLKAFIPKMVQSLYLPISMKWGNADFTFIRPIHYILALFGRKKIKVKAGEIGSSNKTRGHRFLAGNKTLSYSDEVDMETYKKFLLKAGVILDSRERKNIILSALNEFEKENSEKVISDEDLVNETANLVENPSVLKGQFDRQFIIVLPQDVISTVVRKQQKCFPVSKSGYFLIVADGGKQKEIISGYEQVVNARLSDAKFFYDEDIKQPLENNLDKMKKIIYHEKIGSMWDKTQRVIKLSRYIADDVLKQKNLVPIVERVAELSKTDLATHMVGEFSSLAGIMGREYSLVAGEDIRIAKGIFEHYLPRHAKDVLPEDLPGAVVGIADRLDTLTGCFCSGIIPTGSEDPYGLRRAAQGIVSVIIGKNMEMPLEDLIDKSMEIQGLTNVDAKIKLLDFIRQREKVLLEGEKVRYDVADAVLKNSNMIIGSYCKAFEIMKVLDEDWFKAVVLTSDRISRICAAAKNDAARPEDFIEDGEKTLYKVFCQVKDILNDQLGQSNYSAALKTLSQMTKPADIFFEQILVMHQDEKIKNNRLALLKSIDGLYRKFADFPKIVI